MLEERFSGSVLAAVWLLIATLCLLVWTGVGVLVWYVVEVWT